MSDHIPDDRPKRGCFEVILAAAAAVGLEREGAVGVWRVWRSSPCLMRRGRISFSEGGGRSLGRAAFSGSSDGGTRSWPPRIGGRRSIRLAVAKSYASKADGNVYALMLRIRDSKKKKKRGGMGMPRSRGKKQGTRRRDSQSAERESWLETGFLNDRRKEGRRNRG